MPVISPEQQIVSELDAYLSSPKLDFEDDPLQWWKSQSRMYPHISKLVPKYVSVSATSVASERVFSTSGNIVTPHRANLKPDKVEMLTFLSKNL